MSEWRKAGANFSHIRFHNGTMVSVKMVQRWGHDRKTRLDVRIQDNSDRTGTALSPALRATVTLNGNERSSIVFRWFYNSETSFFKIITAVPTDSGGTQKMEIAGAVHGDVIEGKLPRLTIPTMLENSISCVMRLWIRALPRLSRRLSILYSLVNSSDGR